VIEEWRHGWRSASQWPSHAASTSRDGGGWFKAITTICVVVGISGVVVELSWSDLRQWTADRPVFVGIASALIVVTPLGLGFERYIAAREARRWRRTAIGGVQTYMWQADRFNRRFIPLLLAADEQVRAPDEGRLVLERMLARIALQRPEFFERLGELAAEEANANGHLALSAASAMALYPRLAKYVDPMWAIQQTLREIEDGCVAIAFLRGHHGTSTETVANSIIEEAAQKIGKLTRRRQDALVELRFDLELLEEVEPPQIAEVQDLLEARLHESTAS
jgi:hypothetical protein